MVFLVAARELRRVEAAARAFRHLELEVALPPAVVERVFQEVDGGVLLGGVAEVHLLAGPARAAHRPDRQVDELPVDAVRGDVDDVVAVDPAGEVQRHAQRGA